MKKHDIAGYRIIEFSLASKEALRAIAECLIPHRDEILSEWVRRQCDVWEPPNLDRQDLLEVFADILDNILNCMRSRKLELCIDELEIAGTHLAGRKFPFEALVVSVHFLEESYLPFILQCDRGQAQERLIAMDEFLHAAIAAIATSYFEAYRRELLDQAEVGRLVQEGLLPDIPRRTADLEIAHTYISARERARLGGDFLDYFTMNEGGAGFIIGDLAGHGIEAAADSIMLRSLFRGFLREREDLSDAMGRLNRVLMTELKSGLFATALAISYRDGKISLVNAGHPFPVLCNSHARLLELGGTALAVDSGSCYGNTEFELEPGGVIVAYTDGLIEARSEEGEYFGEERVAECVADMRSRSARAIVECLVDRSLRHTGGRFADDVAVLVIKRRA